MDTAQVAVHGWMDKHNVVYAHNGILFSLKKEGDSDTYYNMVEPWIQYAKWNVRHTHTPKTNTIWFHWYEVSRVVKIIETKCRLVVARGQAEGNGELLINGHGISVLQDENIQGWMVVMVA